jgi:hypothetical protein
MSNFDDRIDEIEKQLNNITNNINNMKTVKYILLNKK